MLWERTGESPQPYWEFAEDSKQEEMLAMSLIMNKSWWTSKEQE